MRGNVKESLKDVDEAKLSKPVTGSSTESINYDQLADNPESVPQGEVARRAKKQLWTTQQVLETMIQKGFRAIQEADYLDVTVLLKALDTYLKYYGDNQ